MSSIVWRSTGQVATRTGRSPSRIRLAAEREELHGHQRVRNGRPVPGSRWTFADDAVDAWVQGLDIRAQIDACGCARHLRAVRRAG